MSPCLQAMAPLWDASWNITVQWLAGDIACRTLMFLKLMAMYAAAFLPVVIGLDRQAAVLHPLGPRSAGRKLLGAAWLLSFLLALPQVLSLTSWMTLAKPLEMHRPQDDGIGDEFHPYLRPDSLTV